MKLILSSTLRDFKRDVEANFREIAEYQKKIGIDGKGLDALLDKLFSTKYDQLQKEIRAIVLPEMSPLQVTDEVQKSKIDLKGREHKSLSERIQSDFNDMKRDTKKNQEDSRIVVTSNGTIMHDFANKSNIKKIKSVACIGDSVARGSRAKKTYGQYISEKINARLTNIAVSGATMSTVKANSIYEQATKIRNADLVILQGTDDDWLHGNGVPIGKDKTDVKTFYGAFYQAVEAIRLYNKGAKIIAMTATRQLPVNGTTVRRKDTDKNKLGLTLEDYVDAQVIACSELNIPVFDAYHTDLIDPYNPAFRVKNMVDGLHPNELGHEVIAYELIKNYYYFYG